jgi:hypothetical protein
MYYQIAVHPGSAGRWVLTDRVFGDAAEATRELARVPTPYKRVCPIPDRPFRNARLAAARRGLPLRRVCWGGR